MDWCETIALLMFVSSGNKIDNAILGCHDKQFIIGPFFDKGRSGIWVGGWLWLKCLVSVGRQVRAYTNIPTSHYISLSNSTNSIITESILDIKIQAAFEYCRFSKNKLFINRWRLV